MKKHLKHGKHEIKNTKFEFHCMKHLNCFHLLLSLTKCYFIKTCKSNSQPFNKSILVLFAIVDWLLMFLKEVS
jgi:hypothetical protein